MTVSNENQRDDWVTRAAAGDRASLDSLLLFFHDPLRQFIGASIALGDSAGISHDDLFQESIIAAIRGIRHIQPRGADAFFAWLKEIARNTHVNMIKAANAQKRGGGRQRITGSDNSDPAATSILNQIAGSDAGPSLLLRRKEAIEAIAIAITRLNPEQRRLIDLYYKPEMSVRELAKQLDKSEEAIRTGIHRILKTLRDMLASEFGEFSGRL
jgi:RNA polymerase sigma factor (sigma-70 family)